MDSVTMLSEAEAWKIAASARKHLHNDGRAASICVVNSMGKALVQSAMDGSQGYTLHIARLKARQAAQIGRRTRFLRDKVADPDHPYTPELLGIKLSRFIPWAGGVPVFAKDGTPLGGIGISNLSEDQDEHYCILAVEESGYLSDRPG